MREPRGADGPASDHSTGGLAPSDRPDSGSATEGIYGLILATAVIAVSRNCGEDDAGQGWFGGAGHGDRVLTGARLHLAVLGTGVSQEALAEAGGRSRGPGPLGARRGRHPADRRPSARGGWRRLRPYGARRGYGPRTRRVGRRGRLCGDQAQGGPARNDRLGGDRPGARDRARAPQGPRALMVPFSGSRAGERRNTP